VLASLNHPSIATIYGLEESNGDCALVMELVEGPTLADRIRVPQSSPSSPAEILPDSRAVLFTIWTASNFNWDNERIGVLSLKTGERRVLVEGGTYALYVASGHLVYARAGELLAVPFDLKRLEVTGPPVSILKGVRMSPITGAASVQIARGLATAHGCCRESADS